MRKDPLGQEALSGPYPSLAIDLGVLVLTKSRFTLALNLRWAPCVRRRLGEARHPGDSLGLKGSEPFFFQVSFPGC